MEEVRRQDGRRRLLQRPRGRNFLAVVGGTLGAGGLVDVQSVKDLKVRLLDCDDVVLGAEVVLDDRLGRVVHPLAVDEELVLVLALAQVDDRHEVAVALDHRQRLPVGERARDEHLLAAAVPLEDGRQHLRVRHQHTHTHTRTRPVSVDRFPVTLGPLSDLGVGFLAGSVAGGAAVASLLLLRETKQQKQAGGRFGPRKVGSFMGDPGKHTFGLP